MVKRKKKKAATKAVDRGDRTVMGFSVTKKERAEIKRRAEKYSDGNVSRFIRHAAFTCKTGPN